MLNSLKNSVSLIASMGVFVATFALATTARADTPFDCQPTQVMERSNRVGVKCANTINVSGDTVRFVTYAKTDEARMERFLRLAVSALLGKKRLYVELPDSSADNLNGCAASNCRTVTYPFAIRD